MRKPVKKLIYHHRRLAMLKKVLLCLILGTVIISSGCEKNIASEKNSKETVQDDANLKTENSLI